MALTCALASSMSFAAPALSQSAGSLVVVVNSDSQTVSLSKKELIDIYMGRFKKFPNGESVTPLDFNTGNTHRQAFYEMLVGKSERKINAYWSRLLFSGRATPPQKAESTAEIISIIQSDRHALAYVSVKDVTQGMKIVYEFK